ncbi:hypothetical protein ACSS6W_002799 [Trichoderma asperelloides]|uniref:Uncharacterized protein n=1 Tax=Trichoderma asperellum TaxID=101201 RepID=A0A6V8QRZ3_TRIAP|nr:hypothetical protein LI328DRAFT_160994 [Trichoderma asperelloides]GFP54902.1 hypothetical protein TASIC1_0004052700 [Trichoderma asperellum]
MAAPKMTMALAGLFVSGAFATTPFSDCQSTVTAEPQQIGSTTSNGVLMYSMNYCTVIESTQCHVSLATATTAVAPESSADYSAPTIESTIQAATTTPVIEETIVPSEPAPTTVMTEVAPDASQATGEIAATVISTTDSLGNPTLETSSGVATGSAVTTGGTLSASSSATGKQQTNSTATSSKDSPSGSMTAPSAPDRTSAGAVLKALPSVALGTAAMVMVYFI